MKADCINLDSITTANRIIVQGNDFSNRSQARTKFTPTADNRIKAKGRCQLQQSNNAQVEVEN
jgi:hypothetical protein